MLDRFAPHQDSHTEFTHTESVPFYILDSLVYCIISKDTVYKRVFMKQNMANYIALAMALVSLTAWGMGNKPQRSEPIRFAKSRVQKNDEAERKSSLSSLVASSSEDLRQESNAGSLAQSLPRASSGFGSGIEAREAADGSVKFILATRSAELVRPSATPPATAPTQRRNNSGLSRDQLLKLGFDQEQTFAGILSVVTSGPAAISREHQSNAGDSNELKDLTSDQRERLRGSGQSDEEKRLLKKLLEKSY